MERAVFVVQRPADVQAAGPEQPAVSSGLHGVEWVIDAYGCDAAGLRDRTRVTALFERLIDELRLTPVAAPVWHVFPAPGGLTGFVVLAESHLACHTFPEFGSICVNVFCCRPRGDIDLARVMADVLGAKRTVVRAVERLYAAPDMVRE